MHALNLKALHFLGILRFSVWIILIEIAFYVKSQTSQHSLVIPQVVGYGPRDPLSMSPVERVPGRLGRPRKAPPPPPPPWDDGGTGDGMGDMASEPPHMQFADPALGVALEQMRQLRVDCNTVLVDVDKRQMVYVSCGYRCC